MIGGAGRRGSILGFVRTWYDTSAGMPAASLRRVHWSRIAPYALLHLGCLGVILVGWSPVAVSVAIGFYVLRAFFVTGFYHRYFSHRAYKTSRVAQFVFAVLGATAAQRGPLWWAAHHRRHHQTADRPGDPHSPHLEGFLWSHIGWLTTQENFPTDLGRVPDLARFPELRWLDRYDTIVPLAVGVGMYALGVVLNGMRPDLATSGSQMLVWGFFVSTAILLHATCLVNSAAHQFGRRRFDTPDQSRNSLLIALVTLGEGWHNNHHRYPASARQGFKVWEIDVTYYILKALSWVGLIWDLAPVPAHVLVRRQIDGAAKAE